MDSKGSQIEYPCSARRLEIENLYNKKNDLSADGSWKKLAAIDTKNLQKYRTAASKASTFNVDGVGLDGTTTAVVAAMVNRAEIRKWILKTAIHGRKGFDAV